MFNITQKYIKFFVLFRIKNVTYLHLVRNYLLFYITNDILEFHLIILSTMFICIYRFESKYFDIIYALLRMIVLLYRLHRFLNNILCVKNFVINLIQEMNQKYKKCYHICFHNSHSN